MLKLIIKGGAMKIFLTISIMSFWCMQYTYGANSDCHGEIPFELWAKMSDLGIDYKEEVEKLGQCQPVDFNSLFKKMEHLATQLPKEKNVDYQILIHDRQKEVTKLQKLSSR